MPDDEPCLRCGHLESEHSHECLGFCDEYGCSCQGFVGADTFESEGIEVEELHLGEES